MTLFWGVLNGIGTHFIPHAEDHGIREVTAASAMAIMGSMNFVGTILSGWLTDRQDPRRLLACYYTFRGLSLFFLPVVTDFGLPGLTLFAIVFGLDFIATVATTDDEFLKVPDLDVRLIRDPVA